MVAYLSERFSKRKNKLFCLGLSDFIMHSHQLEMAMHNRQQLSRSTAETRILSLSG